MDNRTFVNMKMVEEIRLKKEVYGGYCIEIHTVSGGIIPIHLSEIEPLRIVYNKLRESLELGGIVELVDGAVADISFTQRDAAETEYKRLKPLFSNVEIIDNE